MPITAICLLKVPSLPLPEQGPVRAETLEDSVLLHTTLDFSDDPEDVAGAVRSLLGEDWAEQHEDERGVFLIPSVAAPRARSYDQVIEEVGEGGVWAPWDATDDVQVQLGAAGPGLSGLLGSMLGQMPEGMFERAAASLRDDPSALQDAAAQLPGLLQSPGALQDLLQQGSSQMPELASMLRGMGLDVNSPELSQITSGLQAELSRDPARLLALAENLFAGAQPEQADDEDDDEPNKR
ncbi:MAG TPA: hypothetical protein VFN67_30015 [Polyangiales bacterium]|nr:hypothetical protein [Polyangiales bacterium]